jgi:pimeloyl-ACP methyl ester carboxylesterase
MSHANSLHTAAAKSNGVTPSVEAWFAGGERVGYDPQAPAIVDVQGAPLKVFLKHEGDLAHAVSFLPGYPDGSFGWAKVLPYLPNAAAMPKLFVDYVGMGDSDKPMDYAYSTAERTDLVEAVWRDLSVQSTTLVAFDFSSLVVLEHLRRRLERSERGEPQAGPTSAVFSSSMAGSSPTDTPTHGTPRRSCAACPSGSDGGWGVPLRCSRWWLG